MTNSIQLPSGFEPPYELTLGRFLLEALAPRHNELDFEALNSCKQNLREIIDPQNFWPEEVLTLGDNLRDLTKDFQEFQDKLTFRYAVLSLDRSSYDGCLYIRPSDTAKYDCRIEFWFKRSRQHLEGEFQDSVKKWLGADWGFKNIAFPGRGLSWEQYHAA